MKCLYTWVSAKYCSNGENCQICIFGRFLLSQVAKILAKGGGEDTQALRKKILATALEYDAAVPCTTNPWARASYSMRWIHR
jgi:hypothetical protein